MTNSYTLIHVKTHVPQEQSQLASSVGIVKALATPVQVELQPVRPVKTPIYLKEHHA